MAYTVTELITRAYYLSGVVSRKLQQISGEQLSDGLRLLNAFLSVKTANLKLIPYYKKYSGTFVIGQQEYFVSNLVSVQTATFNIGTLRYPLMPTNRREYFGDARVNNINSLPFEYRFEREKGGGRLYFYFYPQDTWSFEIWGKFGLTNVTYNEDLEDTYDDFYIEYLRHGLAFYICADYNIALQPGAKERLDELETMLQQVSPPDLKVRVWSTMRADAGLNWADVNIGQGWRPS